MSVTNPSTVESSFTSVKPANSLNNESISDNNRWSPSQKAFNLAIDHHNSVNNPLEVKQSIQSNRSISPPQIKSVTKSLQTLKPQAKGVQLGYWPKVNNQPSKVSNKSLKPNGLKPGSTQLNNAPLQVNNNFWSPQSKKASNSVNPAQ